LYPLHRKCQEILQSAQLPEAYRGGENLQSPERDLPLRKNQVDSLREMFGKLPDPRRNNRSYPISSLLCLVAMGLFAGKTNLAEIQRYGQFLTSQQCKWLGWPRKKGAKGYKAPSYKALYNLLGKLDPEAFSGALCRWMGSHLGSLPRALALDGKYVRDKVLTLCLSEHRHGTPVAVAIAADKPRTEDNKKDGELTKAKALLGNTNLDGAVVTGDALYDTKAIARQIVENGGDYLVQTKDARRKPVKRAKELLQGDSFFFPTTV
jgi:hypothetical protein